MKVDITRQSGAFGPNRVHEVRVEGHAMLVNIVGSGAISLRASVDKEGILCLPSRQAAWTISISSTGGGKVSETLSGVHSGQGFEASIERHRGFMLARTIFIELWGHWFDPQAEQLEMAEAISKEFRCRGNIPTAPATSE